MEFPKHLGNLFHIDCRKMRFGVAHAVGQYEVGAVGVKRETGTELYLLLFKHERKAETAQFKVLIEPCKTMPVRPLVVRPNRGLMHNADVTMSERDGL